MKIGNIELKHGIILAPLAGFTNEPFRRICAEMGAEYTVSEMVSAKAVCFGDKKTAILARIPSDIPTALQLFGSEPEVMYKATKILTDMEYIRDNNTSLPIAIDINMGCPVHKIVSNGEGSALMRDIGRACEIVAAVKEASPVSVTVKIRAGYTKDSRNAPVMAERLCLAGADAICIHGRTREQMYSGTVDRDIIKETVMASTAPVIANGDIKSAEDALMMYEYTGCAAIMIGRGAVGNPWIFEEVSSALTGKAMREIDIDERCMIAKRHLRDMCALMGERRAVPEARRAVCAYFTDFSGAASARAKINEAQTAAQMCDIIDSIFLR